MLVVVGVRNPMLQPLPSKPTDVKQVEAQTYAIIHIPLKFENVYKRYNFAIITSQDKSLCPVTKKRKVRDN